MLGHYLHTAVAAARVLDPVHSPVPALRTRGPARECMRDCDEALAWFAAERKVLAALIAQAARDGADDHAHEVAWALALLRATQYLAGPGPADDPNLLQAAG